MNDPMIVCDPKVMMGKPVVAGTRITVELILRWLAEGRQRKDCRDRLVGAKNLAAFALRGPDPRTTRPMNRIVGLETEYGCLTNDPSGPPSAVGRVRNWIFEKNRFGLADMHQRDWDEPAGNGGFLFNGGRAYVDMGHLEYCTPECASSSDVVRYDRAGDLLLLEAVRALLLWRVTGGRYACERLAEEYYGQYIEAARQGGMAAVCEMEHWKERIQARPSNRDALMKMSPEQFIKVMSHWREYFLKGADLPVIGATEEDLRSIKVPTCVVPGNDLTHGPQVVENLRRAMPHAEVYNLFPKFYNEALSPREEWDEKAPEMAELFADFIKRATTAQAG